MIVTESGNEVICFFFSLFWIIFMVSDDETNNWVTCCILMDLALHRIHPSIILSPWVVWTQPIC
ncbi:hypothetical protein HMPREF1257_01873 [Corynebacterium sp. KPL1814]|nr:hypothetical protein HMPREF1281_01816 [Corynebacterium sp. KPL1855]ERS61634.1 hypothetical protein HMPREF1257_01873 [Corynebacterium sp. KPL1814]ERS79911.1 hypothetical protein HMPREF1285_01020 [Corynebacterium sp. KPL1859]